MLKPTLALPFLLISLFILSACSNKKPPEPEEFFRTQIRDDASKEFSFSLIFSRNERVVSNKKSSDTPKRERGKGKEHGQGNRKRSDDVPSQTSSNKKRANMSDKMADIFQQRLYLQMEKSQYCRKGYLTLEKSFIGVVYTLRGECFESATQEEQKQFMPK